MQAISADFRLAVLILFRSRLWLVALVLSIVLALIAWLAGQFSPRQPATVALDVGISFIRLVVPVLGLLQIQELLAREVEKKLILTSLTYPRSRASFVLARYAGTTLVGTLLVLILALVLAAMAAYIASGHQQATKIDLGLPYIITVCLIVLDMAVIVAFGVMLATIATAPHLVLLAGIGFMVITRSASTIVTLLQSERDLVIRGAEWYQQGLQWVQWLVPDLAALDVRPIALYGKMQLMTAPAWALVAMPAAYIAILLAIACMRFEKRQFN